MNTNTQKNIDKKDIDTLNALYKKMFAGLSLLKWSKQNSCGRGWQNAMDICGAMIGVMKKKHHENNPVIKHIDELHNKCKKNWSRTIMTHSDRDNVPTDNPEKLSQMARVGANLFNSATREIEKICAKYNLRTAEKEQSAKHNKIKSEFLIAQFKQFNQRVA